MLVLTVNTSSDPVFLDDDRGPVEVGRGT